MEDGFIIYAHTPVCDHRLAPGGSDFPACMAEMMNSTYSRQSQGKDSGRLSGLAVSKEIQ